MKIRLSTWLGSVLITLFCSMIIVLFASRCSAQHAWTLEERHDLAKCLVAEAPWDNQTEQAAVGHVLMKRWLQVRTNNPTYAFGDMVRSYCAIFKLKRLSPRQRWIMNLPYGWLQTLPPDDPKGDQAKYADAYGDLLSFVDLLANGNIKDPTPSAMHWGNLQDHRERVRIGKLGRVRRISGTVEDIGCPGKTVRLANLYYVVIDAHPKKTKGQSQRRVQKRV